MSIKIMKEFVLNFSISNKRWIKNIPILGKVGKRVYHLIVGSEQSRQVGPFISQKDYSGLSVGEVKRMMNERFSQQKAYQMTCLWDQMRSQELNRKVRQLITPTDGMVILEVGCGIGGSASYISDCNEFIGTDLSEVAISEATKTYSSRSNFKFVAMDAMNLKFKDDYFNIVIAQEVIEHLPDPESFIKEAFRVLKSSGLLIVTSPNRDSLHLRVNRMLGNPDFKCSFDHIKEFTFQEAVQMLTKEGFKIKDTQGVFLQPYWGISGIDNFVRRFTDDDPAMVEMLRVMGDRIGAEYAFLFIILAEKP